MAFGTGLAQLIAVAAAPLLTRSYDATAFGTLAVVQGIAFTISAVASANYEVVAAFTKDDEEAANGLALACTLCGGVALITFIGIMLSRHWLGARLGNPDLVVMLPWAPVA